MMATAKDMSLLIRSVMAAMIVRGAIYRGEFLPPAGQGNRHNCDKICNRWSGFLQSCLTEAVSKCLSVNIFRITDENIKAIQIQSKHLIQKLPLVSRLSTPVPRANPIASTILRKIQSEMPRQKPPVKHLTRHPEKRVDMNDCCVSRMVIGC
jgi:hypothetical protein